ncbi:hypothetical protein D3C80_1637470 [compost metagenome]
MRGLQPGAGFGRGDKQIGAAVAFAFFDLFAGGRLLQRNHLGHPGGGGKQAEVGLFVEPVGRFVVAAHGVIAIYTVEPAFQGRAQEFQIRIADDDALHGVHPCYCAVAYGYLISLLGVWHKIDVTLLVGGSYSRQRRVFN